MENHLLQLQEVRTVFFLPLHDAQATHNKFANCHHLNTSPKMPKLQVEDCVCGDNFYIGTMGYTHIQNF